ncbi:alpha/beta fold hydrolase [Terriglobus saanensis]|uniref:Alpha/beta hydrolase fold protein n=1 Tax=Terriglobus saanensis (strain ATCC BAA-1853 / DSM 23119 / SP1PR4) TaxID=401053 RepID=E8UZ33_TERSS|nr:alpha/beta hydrolase [Terriglobus saanensis]ADV80978.1 alpha/beta hydrolase fold protein [Terriglobus saanensis SP1PR4]
MLKELVRALLLASVPLAAQQRWQTLPPTPAPVAGEQKHYAEVNGIRLFYATLPAADGGHSTPVVLLHGGLANSDYWGNQVRALHPHHSVILVDSRGHGRSTRSAQPFGYDLMADDVVALLDSLHIPQADIVGWSDGAILGIDLALRHPSRVRRVFAFAANVTTDGVRKDVDKNPNFAAFMRRGGEEYRRLSPTPTEYDAFTEQISHMWFSQPDWTAAQLATIHTPVLAADGDHDEGIVQGHTEKIAAMIPNASLLILPNASHFAFLQAPTLFNTALLDFLDRP